MVWYFGTFPLCCCSNSVPECGINKSSSFSSSVYASSRKLWISSLVLGQMRQLNFCLILEDSGLCDTSVPSSSLLPQDEEDHVQRRPAGGREDRLVQSSRRPDLPAPPPQYRTCSTSHPPQGGAAQHLSTVSPERLMFPENVQEGKCKTDLSACVPQWNQNQSELVVCISSLPVYRQATGPAPVPVPHPAGPHCVRRGHDPVHSKSTVAEEPRQSAQHQLGSAL